MKRNPWKYVWLSIAFISLGIGAIGVVLPILPTTPLLLLRDKAVSEASGQFCEGAGDDAEDQALYFAAGFRNADPGVSDDAESAGKDCDRRIDPVQIYLFLYKDQNSSGCLRRQPEFFSV